MQKNEPPRPPRRTHCKHDHVLTAENLYQRKDGGRECLTCRRIRARANRFKGGPPLFLKWTLMGSV